MSLLRTEAKANGEGKVASDGAAAKASTGQPAKKCDDTGSPAAHSAKLGQGFGGMGAHPLLKSRAFNKLGANKAAASSSSPQPDAVKQQQAVEQADRQAGQPEAAGAGQKSVGGAGMPELPGMLSVQALAQLQSAHAAEDDYDDDYDS